MVPGWGSRPAGVPIAAPAGLVFNANGTFTVTPSPAFQALDTGQTGVVTYHFVASDGLARSAVKTITITVTGANDAPVASDIIGSTTQSATFAGSLAATDVDANDAALTFKVVDASGNATTAPEGVTLDANGVFAVAPLAADASLALGESRIVTFKYAASDGTAESAPKTVTITIDGTNDAPVGSSVINAQQATEDEAVVTLDLLSGASDTDHNAVLSIANLGVLPPAVTMLADGHTLSLDPGAAALDSLNENDTLSYDISYDVQDEFGLTVHRTARFSVLGVNDVPTATDVSAATSQSTGVSVALGGDDADGETTPANLTYTVLDAAPAGASVEVLNGQFTFNPGTAFISLAQDEAVDVVFSYNATDGRSASSGNATVTITVNGVNDAPLTSGTTLEAAAAPGETTAAVALTATDPDSDNSDPATLSYYVSAAGTDFSAAIAAGILQPLLGQSATLAYTGNIAGLAQGVIATQSFDFVARDGHGALSTAGHITLTVSGVNDAPTIDTLQSGLDVFYDLGGDLTPPTGLLFANDPDAGDTFQWSAAAIDESAIPTGSYGLTVQGNYGNLTLSRDVATGDWSWIYTLSATADFSGVVDLAEEHFSVQVTDAHAGISGFAGLSDTQVLNILIQPLDPTFVA